MANLAQFRADGEPGMFGTMGRNTLPGPGRNNWDMALLKNFAMPWWGDRATVQFRAETYNNLNNTQYETIQAVC